MKNAINYYYNLYPSTIIFKNGMYCFNINDKKYILYNVNSSDKTDDASIIYFISIMKNLFIKFNEVVLNINGDVATIIDKKKFVLFVTFDNSLDTVSLSDIISYNNEVSNLFLKTALSEFVRNKWIKKVDYLEYEFSQFGINYFLIQDSFNYFIGIAETTIMLLSYSIDYKGYLTNKRLKESSTLFDLYNPYNMVIDTKVRNVSEYFKDKMFMKKNIVFDIIDYLEFSNYDSSELYLFFVRMLFPSFYFDVIEDIFFNKKKEQDIVLILSNINIYENLIIKLYCYLLNKINLPNIEWINKRRLTN